MEDIVIIIPSYKPEKEIMMEFIKKVKDNFTTVIVVDDGSGNEYKKFFEEIENHKITVLRHYENLGKGRAIKTAFNYVLNTYKNITGVVTADCDGQHHIEDIIKCAEKLKQDSKKLVIGSRDFNGSHVPKRSKFGNKLTIAILSAFVGIKITDTQSGLRAYGIDTMKRFLRVSGERYEYETNMLIDCKESNIEIAEVPISTIYINNNSSSHFNPIKDSIIIYKIFIKYIIASLSSFILDILLFSLLIKIFPHFKVGIITNIVVVTILSRIVSSTYNFIINAKIVFKNANKKSIIKYFILVIAQMFISAFVVSELFLLLHISATIIKVVIDTIIFIMNFIIQREWVFKNI
ncbi:MAG: glycosyltransferase [Clostridia bacterium]|nr:glycosyltransferase [Clostridia bacterium]